MKLSQNRSKYIDGNIIIESIEYKDIVVVLLKLKSFDEINLPKRGVRNLMAINGKTKKIIWIAELPTKFGGYMTFDNIRVNVSELEAWCGSIYCLIDPETGKVLSEEFVK